MSITAAKPATAPIPVQLSEPECTAFILPHLALPKRGPKRTLGSHRVFHLILWCSTQECNGAPAQGAPRLAAGAKQVGVDLRGVHFNLDGGFDSTRVGHSS
jgi:hypothetical protein